MIYSRCDIKAMNWVSETRFGCELRVDWVRFIPVYRSAGARVLSKQEDPAHHEQICKRASHQHTVCVLRDPAIAHLDEAKDALDHQKRMLALGTHPRFIAILRALNCAEPLV